MAERRTHCGSRLDIVCRLRAAQARRARLLKLLAENLWSLELTAEALGWSAQMLRGELKASGLWARMFKRLA